MIEEGGLEIEAEQPREEITQDGSMDQQKGMSNEQAQLSVADAGQSEPAMYHQEAAPSAQTKAEELQPKIPADVRQPNLQPEPQQQPVPAAAPFESAQHDPLGDMSTVDMNDTSMMEGMDIDVNDSNIDFDDTELDTEPVDASTTIQPSAQPPIEAPGQQAAQGTVATAAAQTANAAATLSDSTTTTQQQLLPQQTQPSTSEECALTGERGMGEGVLAGASIGSEPADASMFNDSTFDDFTNMDDGNEGDGLIDFEGGGLGMDDSAFGEALHGMEQPEGEEGNTEGS